MSGLGSRGWRRWAKGVGGLLFLLAAGLLAGWVGLQPPAGPSPLMPVEGDGSP